MKRGVLVADVLLEMKNIQKYFAGVHALDDVSLTIHTGEVHALVGENGAGKSTLMKILTGIHRKDGGSIFYRGKEVDINTPLEAQSMGIIMIHQELNLMPHLTVAQNIFIGREPVKGIFLDISVDKLLIYLLSIGLNVTSFFKMQIKK
jgi:ribose transport system ATP-binding protein